MNVREVASRTEGTGKGSSWGQEIWLQVSALPSGMAIELWTPIVHSHILHMETVACETPYAVFEPKD